MVWVSRYVYLAFSRLWTVRRHWSKLERDDELVWGRAFNSLRFSSQIFRRSPTADAPLTPLGKDQAKQVRAVWQQELPFNIFLPETHYCSPMTRAMQTCLITFEGISLTENSARPIVLEVRDDSKLARRK